MLTYDQTVQTAIDVFEKEAQAISNLKSSLNLDFYNSIEAIFHSKGRVVITGIGKSAIIAQKLVATFNSTGTPSIFMHAADAVHGDLGIVQKDDIVICISKSGNTAEIKVLISLLKSSETVVVAIVGNKNSYLAQKADFILDTTVDKEACPNNLAPTSSTAAQMAMGDALSVCLLQCRSFGSNDFARFHPGGSLGKKLYLRVNDLYIHNQKPEIAPDAGINEVIMEITEKRLGATAVVENGELAGMITDGDLRRMLSYSSEIKEVRAREIMSVHPKTILPGELAINALELMRENKITQLIVSENNLYIGMIHIHDLNREGLI